ncbi:ribosome silencing factor [Peribacillus kribbensis]|uniref:ribosome silencing factor n=1 Tax=Peribacillus kribbensis TaxID=356658 RepID=UPI00040EB8F8|nr:ribosome silencing factor [Peribacillus kribbensis]
MNERELLITVAKAADDKRAEDILALNMKGISLVSDYFLICHGGSDKQVQAIAREMREKAEEKGYFIKRMEGFDEAKWILVDLGDVVAHVFHRDERSYYNLERLWGDAPREDIGSELSQ